jgi:hypothetical protein
MERERWEREMERRGGQRDGEGEGGLKWEGGGEGDERGEGARAARRKVEVSEVAGPTVTLRLALTLRRAGSDSAGRL